MVVEVPKVIHIHVREGGHIKITCHPKHSHWNPAKIRSTWESITKHPARIHRHSINEVRGMDVILSGDVDLGHVVEVYLGATVLARLFVRLFLVGSLALDLVLLLIFILCINILLHPEAASTIFFTPFKVLRGMVRDVLFASLHPLEGAEVFLLLVHTFQTLDKWMYWHLVEVRRRSKHDP